ncbi:MAG: alpha/beta hydrolase [Chloroflexi bacterium]|nr:alpha/beta hydrolase [Chloroflexota bacterium]
MFDNFKLDHIDTGEATIRVRIGGSGPPVLLLHGHPQTHCMWHAVAADLARHFTVVAPDLRGYGESSKPQTTPDHEPYSKRAMARDNVNLMRSLGFETFNVAGHDRGGRVAYRLALDHPDRVQRLATLDILPTYEHFHRADMQFGLGYWHWFFLAQPFDMPERVIGLDPVAFFCRQWPLNADGKPQPPGYFAPEALADYLRCYADPHTVHATCEDYRAGATYDYATDEADLKAGKKITCPMLALWAAKGELPRWYDVLAVWRDWATDVRGQPINSGHFMAEEAPQATASALREFFSADG